MKIFGKKALSIVLCLVIAFVPYTFGGCDSGNRDYNHVTISFYEDSDAQQPFQTMQVEKGAVPDLGGVTPPDRQGQTFVGWTDARNSSTPYDPSAGAENDLDLFGMWQPSPTVTVKVTFSMNYAGGKTVVREGQAGAPMEFPTAERTNFVFRGWFRDKECTTPYESLDYPEANTTLYAGWTVADGAVLVTYMLGGEQYAETAVMQGGKAENLACSPRDYVFLGWLDGSGKPYDFATPVSAALTLNANIYSKGLEISGGKVIGFNDEDYDPTNIIVPAMWLGDDGIDDPVQITAVSSLGGLPAETIVIAEGITEIGDRAFADCQLLKRIVIPSTVTYIGVGIFVGCESLTSRSFAGNETLEVRDGMVLSEDKTEAIVYIGDEPTGTYTLPESVTYIESYAFAYANIEKLVVPDTVESIGQDAFATSLIREAEINIKPGTQKYLPQRAFEESPLLKKVTLSAEFTTIQERAFYRCESLSDITINAATVNLRNNAFGYCTSLETFPFDKVQSMGEGVFAYAGIKEFAFKETDTEIAPRQFENWNNLQRIVLPAGITTIGESAFDGCESLAEMQIAPGSRLAEIGASAFAGTKLTKLDLTACTSLKVIGANAFDRCTSLTRVKLPDSLDIIGSGAFSGCSAIEEMALPFVGSFNYNGYRTYFEEVFIPLLCNSLAYNNLTSPTYYTNLYEADPDSFAASYLNKSGQEWYELHKEGQEEAYNKKILSEIFDTPSLFGYIFGRNSYAGSVVVNQFVNVTDSGTPTTYSFYIPQSLKKITITGKYISACAFNSLTSYTGEYVFTDKLEGIGARAFSSNSVVPSFDFSTATSLKTIGASAFANDRALTSVVLPDSLEVLGDSAFRECTQLQTVQVPAASAEKPLVLGAYAFNGCENLSSFYTKGDTPQEGVFKFKNVDVSNYTFYGCTKLKVVESRESVGFVMGFYGGESTTLICNAFYTDSLTEVHFPDNASKFRYTLPTLSTGEVISKEAAERQGFIEGCIPGRLFSGCVNLKSFNSANGVDVVIPEGVTAIGPYAFQALSGPSVANMPIETIKFPASLKSVGEGAFGHTDLKDVDVSMATDLGSGFDYADKMERVVIADDLKLTNMVFRSCASLKTVALKNRASGEITERPNVALLPAGTTEIPNYAFQNTGIEEIELQEGIKTLGFYSFYGASSLKSVKLPASLEEMQNGVFERAFALNKVEFAEEGNLRYIDEACFEYCTSLQSIELPEGVAYLGNNAFMGCINLERAVLPSTLFYAGGASTFCNCLNLKEVLLLGSVPPQIDFDIASADTAYSAFNIVDQTALASIPDFVAAELAKVPENITQNARSMTENLKDFEWLRAKTGLKIYIPEDSAAMYNENIVNALRVTGGNTGIAQRPDFGWHNYKSAFTTYETGIFAETGNTTPLAFYLTSDGSAWMKSGKENWTKVEKSGNAYTYLGGSYTYDPTANTLFKGGTAMKSIGGLYMDVTAEYSKGAAGTADASGRLLQFRPQLVIGSGSAASMFVYDGSKVEYNNNNTLYVPKLYYGAYTLEWAGDVLTVRVTFSEITEIKYNSDPYIERSEIRDTDDSEPRTIEFTLTEEAGAFKSGDVTGTQLGADKVIRFTRGCTVAA